MASPHDSPPSKDMASQDAEHCPSLNMENLSMVNVDQAVNNVGDLSVLKLQADHEAYKKRQHDAALVVAALKPLLQDGDRATRREMHHAVFAMLSEETGLSIDVNFPYDPMDELPVELRANIARFLEKSDLWRCLHVSNSWRKTFMIKEVVKDVAKTHFLGLIEHAQATGVQAEDLMQACIRKHHLRSLGRFRSVLYHGFWLEEEEYFVLDPTLHPLPRPSPRNVNRYSRILAAGIEGDFKPIDNALQGNIVTTNVQYAHGRIVWQPSNMASPDNSLIIVDNLRDQTRKIYREPGIVQSGGVQSLEAIGDRLVIAANFMQLIAWNLETNQRHSIKLPQVPRSVATSGMRVVIVCNDDAIYAWTVGSIVVQVDPNPPAPDIQYLINHKRLYRLGLIKLSRIAWGDLRAIGTGAYPFIHPGSNNTCYTAQLIKHDVAKSAFPEGVISIHQYEGSEHKGTFVFDCHELHWIDFGHKIWLKPRQSDNYGTFAIATIWMKARGHDGSSSYIKSRDCSARNTERAHYGDLVHTVTFNVHTKQWGISTHHPIGGRRFDDSRFQMPKRWHFWEGQLTWWCQDEETIPAGTKFPLFTFNECQTKEKGAGELPEEPSFYKGKYSRDHDARVREMVSFDNALSSMCLSRSCHHSSDQGTHYLDGLPALVQSHGIQHGLKEAHKMMLSGANLAYALDPDGGTLSGMGSRTFERRVHRSVTDASDSDSDFDTDHDAVGSGYRTSPTSPKRDIRGGYEEQDVKESINGQASGNNGLLAARGLCREEGFPRHTCPEIKVYTCEAVFGDDDFLVMVHTQGYTVWAFSDLLPASLGLKDKSAPHTTRNGQYWKRAMVQLVTGVQ